MKVIYKKIIAFICVLSMIVSTFAMNPGTVSAGTDEDGFTQLSTTKNVEQALGKWSKIYKASTWAQPTDVSIKGEGASFDDLAIKINSSNGATAGDDRWAIQAHYPVSGLDPAKTYKCTIKYTSTKAGNMLYKPDGIAGRNDNIYPAVEGENTITDTITGVTGFTAVFALCGMPAGCIVDFTSISVVEESEETTTTSEPVTTPEIIDGTELLKDTEFEEGNVSHWDEYGGNKYTNQGNGKLKVEIPAYESGDNWATQLVQKNIQLYEGKWYVAQFKITSDVDKSFQLLIQNDGKNDGHWAKFAEKEVDVSAGETKIVQIQFQANQSTAANVLYGIMMGYINGASKAANVTIENVSLKVYND